MAGFAEKVANHQLSSADVNWTDSIKFELGQKVKSVAITCMTISANPLLIGWGEDGSSQDYLLPGDSYEVVPDVGNYLDGNEIRFKFGQVDGSAYVNQQNVALVKIKYETAAQVC